MKLKALLFGLTFVLFCGIGVAQKNQPSAQKIQVTQKNQVNQAVQQQQIKQGAKPVVLTKHKTTKLRAQQKNIAKTKYEAKADGVVPQKKKAVIHQKQKTASGNITHKKQNEIKKKQ
jgi:hypothetical protein